MIDTDRHEELLRKGYTVREVEGRFTLYQNGVRVSGRPRKSRAEAWEDASEDSMVRTMMGKKARAD